MSKKLQLMIQDPNISETESDCDEEVDPITVYHPKQSIDMKQLPDFYI
jgi:hypothetical protein